MIFENVIPIIFSLISTLAGVLFILRYFPRAGFLDRPHEYGLKRAPVPYSGGIIFFIVFLIGTFLFVEITKAVMGVIFAGFLIVIVSFIDDRIRLNPWFRLAVQILAGITVVFAGVKIQIISNPFGVPFFLDKIKFQAFGGEIWLFSGIFIIGWLVLMMNVMNWLDGIPGLASGISTIAQIAIFILAVGQFNIVDQSATIKISGMLAASTFVFLFFDFAPPKLLMGDTGSMFLGFMLGSLSILAGGKLATALLIMGFPVLDAFWVILKRLLKGVSPARGDFSHFHHRLLHIGLSQRKALIFNYSICAVFAAIALLLHSSYEKFLAFLAVFILMALTGVFLFVRGKNI